MHALRTFLLACLLLAPVVIFAQREKLPPEDLEIVEKTWPTAKRTATGLRTMILQDSDGPSPKKGDVVSVVYVGKLLDGTIFDQATDPDKPFTFRVGRGQVIEAWEEGLQLLKIGQRRLFIVPFELGYGTRGSPPKIPKRATLIFEVELLSINKDTPTALPAPAADH